jgi:hypothetical protein
LIPAPGTTPASDSSPAEHPVAAQLLVGHALSNGEMFRLLVEAGERLAHTKKKSNAGGLCDCLLLHLRVPLTEKHHQLRYVGLRERSGL